MRRWVLALVAVTLIDFALFLVWGGGGAASEDCNRGTAPDWLCGDLPRLAGATLIAGLLVLCVCLAGLASHAYRHQRGNSNPEE